tara:strand:- start:9013 stop:9417 length:405 start_codon:yes stop_codon:yes gene_type:complete
MATLYFAKLTEEDNEVVNTITLDSQYAPTELAGQKYLNSMYKWNKWKQTYRDDADSVNPRGNYAAQGWKYREDLDMFVQSAAPYPSWTLNETTGKYEAPVAKPETYLSGQEPQFHPDEYTWNESSGQWDRVEME